MIYTPIIIIGAPRSGTNMLRDVLTSIERVGTWPCDEINYIWRHGNIDFESDEFPVELARPRVIKFIRNQFDTLAKNQALDYVVEKTCANSLRVYIVDKVIPEARYVFIYRNGIDSLASARLRWTAELEPGYLYSKARFVPIGDLPYYALKYIGNRFHRFVSKEKRLAFWGPQLEDMQSLLSRYTLEQVCAIQWQRCVEAADEALKCLPEERVVRIRYEDFVSNPQLELKNVLEKLNIPAEKEAIRSAVSGVSNSNVGKGKRALDQRTVEMVSPLICKTLKQHGYKLESGGSS